MMKKYIGKALLAMLIAALALSAASCAVLGLLPDPAALPEWPKVTAAPGKIPPPSVSRFEGYSVRIKPVKGPEVVLTEPIAAEQLMDAFNTERLKVDGAIGKFDNRVDILDQSDEVRYSFAVASDGQLLVKSGSKAFRMPEYIYYLLEQRLWELGGSLVSGTISWQPEKKDTKMLETELPRLIKTSMFPAYGYALTYFASYKIYGVNTEVKDTAKLYMLLMYAGYDVQGNAFIPRFTQTGPATLIFKRLRADKWQLVDFRLPVEPKDHTKQAVYDSIRRVFPYEYMEPVAGDMKDTTALNKDIIRQATDYVREQKLPGLSIGD